MSDSRALKVRFLMIGSEILDARRQDLLVATLSRFLSARGHCLESTTMVRDCDGEMQSALSQLRALPTDVIVTSGGLGPTEDDRTKQIVASTLGLELIADAQLLEHIHRVYQDRGRTYRADSSHYHLVPEGGVALHNPVGMAPGILVGTPPVLSLPGVPSEFQALLDTHWDQMMGQHGRRTTVTFRTVGIPEEELFGTRAPGLWEKLEQFGSVSSLPQIIGVDIGVTFSATSDQNEQQTLEAIEKVLRSYAEIGSRVWEIGNRSLPQVVIDEAAAKSLTIAVCESCTGGLLASALTDVPGSSAVVVGGAVTYRNDLKSSLVQVGPEVIARDGAVSVAVAEQMAQGVVTLTGAALGVSTTGIAGPDGATPNKPLGTVAIAVANADGIVASQLFRLPNRGRLDNKRMFCYRALFTLLEAVRDQ